MMWFAIRFHDRTGPRPIDPRVARTLLIAVAIPTLISVASGTIGAWDGSNITRALLATPLGLVAGAIAAAVATKDLR